MHIIDRRLNPRGKSLANRQRFLRRAKALGSAGGARRLGQPRHQRIDRGGEVSIPADGVREPQLPSGLEGGVRDTCCPATRSSSKATTAARRRRRGGRKAAPTATARTISASCSPRRVSRSLPRGPGAARPGQAPARDGELQGLAAGGYSVTGSPANLACAHHAQQPVAAHRAAAPQARGAAALEEEIARLEKQGGDRAAPRRCARSWAAARCGASGGSPISTRSTCATTASSRSQAGSRRRSCSA